MLAHWLLWHWNQANHARKMLHMLIVEFGLNAITALQCLARHRHIPILLRLQMAALLGMHKFLIANLANIMMPLTTAIVIVLAVIATVATTAIAATVATAAFAAAIIVAIATFPTTTIISEITFHHGIHPLIIFGFYTAAARNATTRAIPAKSW
jgi:hypothetical protein